MIKFDEHIFQLGGATPPTRELVSTFFRFFNFYWAVLRDEQMSNGWPFSLLNDEQMSNKVGVEHQPV